jgi:hypothetical protein
MSETNTKRIVVDGVLPSLPVPVSYSPEMLGYKEIKATGRGVSICLIDSGLPDHEAIKSHGDHVNFSRSADDEDHTGHATTIAGILVANKPDQLTGLAPNATLFSAKAVDDNCIVRYDALIASVLWAIIREVDIIVIPLTTDVDHLPFQAAIQKALDKEIFIVAAAGNDRKVEYPAAYEGVISVGSKTHGGTMATYSGKGSVNVKGTHLETTYLDQAYCVSSGTSIATAVAAGLLARSIEIDKTTALARLKLVTK